MESVVQEGMEGATSGLRTSFSEFKTEDVIIDPGMLEAESLWPEGKEQVWIEGRMLLIALKNEELV